MHTGLDSEGDPLVSTIRPEELKLNKHPIYQRRLVYLAQSTRYGVVVAKQLGQKRPEGDSIDPRVLAMYSGYVLGQCVKGSRSYMILRYCGNDLWTLLQRVHNAYTGKALPPSVVQQFYVWALNLMHELSRLHDAGLVHTDIKSANAVIDENGKACLVDLEGVREENARAGCVTPVYCMHTAERQRPETANKQQDLRGLAIIILYMIAFTQTTKVQVQMERACKLGDRTAMQAGSAAFFMIDQPDDPVNPLAYPLLRCAQTLGDEEQKNPDKLRGCYRTLQAAYRESFHAAPQAAGGQYVLRNTFYRDPREELERSCCSIM